MWRSYPLHEQHALVSRSLVRHVDMHVCRALQNMFGLCDTPFQTAPNCYPLTDRSMFMPSGEACAVALAEAHNVSSVPLQSASAVTESIHTACAAVTVQVCHAPDTSARVIYCADWGA